MKLRKIFVVLLALVCLMGFGLSYNKVEAVATNTITLNCKDNGKDTDDTTAVNSVNSIFTETTYVQSIGSDNAKVFLGKTGYGIKLGSSKEKGILSFKLNQSYKITAVTVYTYASDLGTNYNITIGSSKSSALSTGEATTITSNTYTLANPIDTDIIKISAVNASKNRFYITKIEISFKTQLSTPINYSFNDATNTLSWDSISYATGYKISFVDEENRTYSYTSTSNQLVLKDLLSGIFEGYIIAVDSTKEYLDSNQCEVIFENTITKLNITQEILNNITLSKQLSLTCNVLDETSEVVSLEKYWEQESLSKTTNDETYIKEVNFKNEGLKLTSTDARIRPWYNNGYQIRLYTSTNNTFTISSERNIEEIFLTGSENITVKTAGYTFSAEKISGIGSKSVSFTISSNNTITEISVKYSSETSAKYKDFSQFKLRFKTNFVPEVYNIIDSGFVISSLSNIDTNYTSQLPTENNGLDKVFVRSNTTGKVDFTIDVNFDSIDKCKDAFYVYYYVKYTNEAGETKVIYKNFGSYSVQSVINEYSQVQNLDASLKNVVLALKSTLDNNQGGQQ